MPPCQTSIAEVNNGSTAGLQKLTGGPSSSAITASAPCRYDAHVAAARREIDLASLDDLAVDGFARRPMARARQMLGQDRREGRRHVLRDQARETGRSPDRSRRPATSAPAGRRSMNRSEARAAPACRMRGAPAAAAQPARTEAGTMARRNRPSAGARGGDGAVGTARRSLAPNERIFWIRSW